MKEIRSGKQVSLRNGHMPQFLFGLDANKPVPGIGDMYYATDTLKIYNCYINALWTLTSSPAAERYSNHLGAVDNFTTVGASAGWSNTSDAANHEMDQASDAASLGYARFTTKKMWTLGALSSPVICNFILQNIVPGTNAGYAGSKIGLSADFQSVLPNNTAAFSLSPGNVWQTYTIDNAGGQHFTTINPSISNGDLCTIIGVSSYVIYLVNGVLVATHQLNLPTAPMFVGAGIAAEGAAFTVARTWSLDYFDVTVLK